MKAHVELKELSNFLYPLSKGVAMSGDKELAGKLERASYWLRRFENHVCSEGYVGCPGGVNCTSDHK